MREMSMIFPVDAASADSKAFKVWNLSLSRILDRLGLLQPMQWHADGTSRLVVLVTRILGISLEGTPHLQEGSFSRLGHRHALDFRILDIDFGKIIATRLC